MADFATTQDLEDRLGRDLTVTEARQAPAFLTDASDVVRSRFPYLPDLPPAIVRKVVCAMVLRVLRNPEGKRQESIADYSYTIDSSRSAGELYLSDDEYDEIEGALRPATGGGSAFSITPGAPAVP